MFHSGSETYLDSFRVVTISIPKLASSITVKAPRKVTVQTVEGKNGQPVVQARKVRIKATVTTGGKVPTGKVVFKVGSKKVTATLEERRGQDQGQAEEDHQGDRQLRG